MIDDSRAARSSPGPYSYRPDVLAVVWRHGILPTEWTPPELARGYVRELYKYEIRRLRERYLREEFSKRDYAGKVDALRRQYGVLALVPQQWLLADAGADAGGNSGRRVSGAASGGSEATREAGEPE